MSRGTNFPVRSILQAVGSLWFAAVLLVLLMVAMGSATLFETRHSSEQALAVFYHAPWFRGLLFLVAVNILAAICLRIPFSTRHIGFLLTHSGLLIILAGALLTQRIAIEGQVSLTEGRTARSFTVQQHSLTVAARKKNLRVTMDLDAPGFGGFEILEDPDTDVLPLGKQGRVEVVRYLPDMIWRKEVTDDNPRPNPALEVSLSPSGREEARWVFAGQTAAFDSTRVMFRPVSDPKELERLLTEKPMEKKPSSGAVEVEVGGSSFSFPLDSCLSKTVPLGETGYSMRVVRYLPHAQVREGGKILNVSDNPVNPAIEVEFSGPDGKFKQLAFSKFPSFSSMHGKEKKKAVKLVFKTSNGQAAQASVEVLSGPDNSLHVRFLSHGSYKVHRNIEMGMPVDTPWPGKKFAVLKRFDRARIQSRAVVPEKSRKTRQPAILVRLTGASIPSVEVWIPWFTPQSVKFGDSTFDLFYSNKTVSLAFGIKLNRFQVGYYPGTRRPRSFESHVTITDPATGRSQDRIISMNNPTSHGGFTFYQSSYDLRPDGNNSVLSVSRGPDRPVVFAGFFITILGMMWLLATRLWAGRRGRAKPKLQAARSCGG